MTWLSEKISREQSALPEAELGVVSMGGAEPAVVTDGELRQTSLLSPGGYDWAPAPDEAVVVLRGEPNCVAGRLQTGTALEPGDVRIRAGTASILLRKNGSIELTGAVTVNGKRLKTEDEE